MNQKHSIILKMDALPIHEYAFMKPADVIFSNEVRTLCKKNTCRKYGTSWACPPAVGSVKDCKAKCLAYENALMFTTTHVMKKKFDVEGWVLARRKHEETTDAVVKALRDYDAALLALSSEGCLLCKTCAYPDKPCRHTENMYPATEGYGILVMEQARICNVKYNNGANTVTYFSMIFFNLNESIS